VLFNSYEFLLVFLPITLILFYALTQFANRNYALNWLVFTSLAFYSWWNPPYVFFLLGSIVANFLLASIILAKRKDNPSFSALVTILGVTANLLLIGYYKYKNFFLDGVEMITDLDFPAQDLILPLGISFFTFQQIAYLVDARVGVVGKSSFRDYALFVTFFPQLIAGPIVHHKEMMPQFTSTENSKVVNNLVIGSILFSVGLFKKAVIADGFAVYANPVFGLASTGTELDLFSAWLGALAYAFQLYFDFSGYSEMALGLARMFGITLPINFNSPFKQTSIIGFWGHWHITLTRFFTAYIYNPISLGITRFRARKRLTLTRTSPVAFFTLVACPTLITMTLAGLWHGAGAQYVVFGLLHGSYLTVNHAWRLSRPKFWPNDKTYYRIMRPFGWLVTFVSVVVGMVFFRADSVSAALLVIEGMCGLNGALFPAGIAQQFPLVAKIVMFIGIEPAQHLGKDFVKSVFWVCGGLGICLILPNILHILRDHNPVLNMPERSQTDRPAVNLLSNYFYRLQNVKWQPTSLWLFVNVIVVIAGILGLSQVTEFLYWQF
jgi:alginate O-acetyltransferase complex protein AlgI